MKRRKIVINILGIAFLVIATGFFMMSYKKKKVTYNNTRDAVISVKKGDSEPSYQEAVKQYESAYKHLGDPAVENRILFRKWSEIQRRVLEIARTMELEKYEFFYIEKKLEDLKSLVKDVEVRVENMFALKNLSPEQSWKAYNLMGCVRLYQTLIIEQNDDQAKMEKQIQGYRNEAISSFKDAIDVIEENNLAGIETNIPRRNLELMYKKQKEKGEGEGEGDQRASSKSNRSDSAGSDEKKKSKGGKERNKLQKLMPFLNIDPGHAFSPGVLGGEK
jgi:hypothetical protein